MAGTQFTIEVASAEDFYVSVAEAVTLCDNYDDTVAEIQDKLSTDSMSYLPEIPINANATADVAVAPDQIGCTYLTFILPSQHAIQVLNERPPQKVDIFAESTRTATTATLSAPTKLSGDG